MSFPAPTDTPSDTQPPSTTPVTTWLPHLVVVLVGLIGAIVLGALHDLSGEVVAGIIGAAIGGGVAVAGANVKSGP